MRFAWSSPAINGRIWQHHTAFKNFARAAPCCMDFRSCLVLGGRCHLSGSPCQKFPLIECFRNRCTLSKRRNIVWWCCVRESSAFAAQTASKVQRCQIRKLVLRYWYLCLILTYLKNSKHHYSSFEKDEYYVSVGSGGREQQ